MGALASLAEQAVKWSAATTAARFVLQFGAQVTLARLLGPDNYGVYGIGLAILTFVTFLSGASFSWNLMLQPRIEEGDVRFAFSWQMLVGIACAIAMYAAAPALAVFFSDPRVEGMVQLLSIACVLTAAAGPSTCLLQRDMDFRRLGLNHLGSYAVGYLGVGLPMALMGHGAISLGVAAVVQTALLLVSTYSARPHSVRPLFSHAGGATTLATSRIVFLTNIVNWLLMNIDRVLIGRVLNAHAVGLYNVAYNLASVPNTLLLGVLHPTFLATAAKLQEDRERLGQGWLLVLSCVFILATPAGLVLALLSADLVSLLYGAAWAESAWPLALLFLCLTGWTSWGVSTPVLWNTGRRHYEYLLQLPLLAVALPAWWLAAPRGILAVALVAVGVIYIRAAITIVAALRALGLPWATVGKPLARGVLLAAACGAATLAGQHAVAALHLPLVSLAAGSAGAFAVFIGVAVLWPEALGAAPRAVLARVLPFMRDRSVPPLAATQPEGSP